MDFSYSTLEDMQFRLERNINPFTGLKFNDDEKKLVTDMMRIIHAAVNNYEVEFEDDSVYVYIPILDLAIEVEEFTTIQPLSRKISESITSALNGKQVYEFSTKNIQNKLHRFLTNIDLIELRTNKNLNINQYYATEKGESCGLKNLVKQTKNGLYQKLRISAYMQAYLLRIFPEIFVSEIKSEFGKTSDIESLTQKVEPITIKEQDLIMKYRAMNNRNKQLLEEEADKLLGKL